MSEYRFNGRSAWNIEYHLTWIMKYRYKILRGEVAERAREVIRQVCQVRVVRIVPGAITPGHVHMLVAASPQLASAKLVQYIKGRSSRRLQEEFPHLRKRYLGWHPWVRRYFCVTVGGMDEKTLMEYIENQKWDQDGQGFKVTVLRSLEPAWNASEDFDMFGDFPIASAQA